MDLHYGYYRWRVRRLFIDPYLLEQEEGAQLASVVLVIEPGDEKRFCGSGKAWFQFDPNSPADTFAWATPGARNRVGEDVFEVTKLAVIEGGAVAKFAALPFETIYTNGRRGHLIVPEEEAIETWFDGIRCRQ